MNINKKDSEQLIKISRSLREQIVNISYKTKAHHIGSELACIDILVALYFSIMKINPENPKLDSRDWFLLSKGHAALALYVTLAKRGFFEEELVLNEFLKNGGKLGGHPDYNSVPGIESSSGSLGHGLSIGAGVAIARKRDYLSGNIYVLLGDGECNEGMIWEAVMFAAHHKLDNLIAIIDYNNFQGLGKNERILNLNSLSKKFQSFGWATKEIDGHNFQELIENLSLKDNHEKKPLVVIANTIKGKGVKSMENKFESHYQVISNEKKLSDLIEEINS